MARKATTVTATADSAAHQENSTATAQHTTGRGWHGNPEGHAAAGRKGGHKVSQDRAHMAEIGKKGGSKVAQDREHMAEIGRRGGSKVSQNREHMAAIGKKGGERK